MDKAWKAGSPALCALNEPEYPLWSVILPGSTWSAAGHKLISIKVLPAEDTVQTHLALWPEDIVVSIEILGGGMNESHS